MKHKQQYGANVGHKTAQSSENEESDCTGTETSSVSGSFDKKIKKSATQFSVLRSGTDGLRMKISAIRRKTTDTKTENPVKFSNNNNLNSAKVKLDQVPGTKIHTPTPGLQPSYASFASCKPNPTLLIDESDSTSEATINGKIKKIKSKKKKTFKTDDSEPTVSGTCKLSPRDDKLKITDEIKSRILTGLNQPSVPDDNAGLSSSDNELPALVSAAIKCVESDSDSHSFSNQPKIQYKSTLLQDFMEKTQMLSAGVDDAKQDSETLTTVSHANASNRPSDSSPLKKKRGRPKKSKENALVIHESADSGVVSSTAQSTSPSPRIYTENMRTVTKTVERDRAKTPPRIDIVNLDKRMYAMNERVLYPPPKNKLRRQSVLATPTVIQTPTTTANATNAIKSQRTPSTAPPARSTKDDGLDPIWRKIDINSKFRRPSVSGYKSDGAGGSHKICSKILTAQSGYASDYGLRSTHYSGYKSDASCKSRYSMRSCYSRVSKAKSSRRTKFRRKRRPTISHSKPVENVNEQDILQLAGLSLGQSSEESSESARCKPKILTDETDVANVYKKYGEINRYVATGEYFGRSKVANFSGTNFFESYAIDQESRDTYLNTVRKKIYSHSRKSSTTAMEIPLQLGISRKLKSRRSSVASFCSSSFYSGVSKSRRRHRRRAFKYGCSRNVVIDSKLLTDIEIITNSFATMCRINCDKPTVSGLIKEKVPTDRTVPQKSSHQNKRNLKKRKLSENVDYALSSSSTITCATGKRRHKKTCSSSPDDHKLPLKKRHYLLTPGEKIDKTHPLVHTTENSKSQRDPNENKATSGHGQKPNSRTTTTKTPITSKKRHLLQTTSSEVGNKSPSVFSSPEVHAQDTVISKKRNRLEGLVSKIASANNNTSNEPANTSTTSELKEQNTQLPESPYPPPGVFEPTVELEIQIPVTKLSDNSVVTKSEVDSPLDLLDLPNKPYPENTSNSRTERVVESLLNKTVGSLIMRRKRKKINRTGFPSVKRKKRKVSEISLTNECDKQSESDCKTETVCDRVPHTGEASDTFLERNRTPRLSVVSLERLQGINKKQPTNDEPSTSRGRLLKQAPTTNKNKKESDTTTETPKPAPEKPQPRPLSKKKDASIEKKDVLQIAVSPDVHIKFPTCKIRLKRQLPSIPINTSLSTESITKQLKSTDHTTEKSSSSTKQIATVSSAGPSRKSRSEADDFLEQEPLPLAYCDVNNAFDSESSCSASVISEESKSTNRKQKWKKNYLVAGLFSNYYKFDGRKKKAISNPSNNTSNERMLLRSGSLLPPPPYCEKFFRRTEIEFQLPFDIWWAHINDKLRVTVPSWNYRKIRTNVYRGADVRPNTANIDRPTCNCKPNVGCGDDCLNRLVYTECSPSSCPTGEKCQNQKIQRHEIAPGVERFMTENKGWGVRTKLPIKKGTYILEYVGEVVTEKEFKERMATLYSNDTHHYCLHLDGGLVIDGHRMGSDGRFVNHSCSPNCEMQKWSVNGLSRMALFAARNIEAGEEISYDYNFSLFNPSEGQECRCNTPQCRGVIGGKSQRIKPIQEVTKPLVELSSTSVIGRRIGRQRKRQGSARKDIVRVQSRDITMTQLLQQLPDKEKRVIRLQRLFLLRNFEKVRRIKSKGLTPDAAKPENSTAATPPRRPSTPSALAVQISALRGQRNIQTRGLAQAVQDPEVEKMAKMAVIFRDLCSSLESVKDENDRPLISKFSQNSIKRKGKNVKQQKGNVFALKSPRFATIQANVEKGFYKDPNQFDEDVRNLFVASRELFKNNEEKLTIINKLSDLYMNKKTEVHNQLLDLGIDKTNLQSFRKPQPPVERKGALGKMQRWSKGQTEDIIGCICGLYKDEGLMIQCARCMVWQHTECTKADVNADNYLCEKCEPRVVDKEIPLDDFTEDDCRYYLSLMRGDLQVRQGDTVYVLRDIPMKDAKGNVIPNKKHTYDTIGKIDYSECDIFRVERLWKNKENKRVVFGHHFLRPHETFHEPSRRFYPNEVIRVPLYEVVPIELIIGRCWVLDRTTFCKGRPADCTAEKHVFICELRVDKTARFFSKAKINWPTCTKNYAFKRFPEKLRVSKTYAPHDVDPQLLKPRRPKPIEVSSTPSSSTPKQTPATPKQTLAIRPKTPNEKREVTVLPIQEKKRKRSNLEAVVAAVKKLKWNNTQMHENILDVSYLLSGRGARQRKSVAKHVPM